MTRKGGTIEYMQTGDGDPRESAKDEKMTTTREIKLIDPRSVSANSDQVDFDDENVSALVAAIRAGEELPPVVVVEEWSEVRDGCHRRAAAIKAGVSLRAVFISSAEYKSLRADGIADCGLTDEIC